MAGGIWRGRADKPHHPSFHTQELLFRVSFIAAQSNPQCQGTQEAGASLSLLCKHMHIRVCIDLHVLILMNEKSPWV